MENLSDLIICYNLCLFHCWKMDSNIVKRTISVVSHGGGVVLKHTELTEKHIQRSSIEKGYYC